jgi:hypothetical protein
VILNLIILKPGIRKEAKNHQIQFSPNILVGVPYAFSLGVVTVQFCSVQFSSVLFRIFASPFASWTCKDWAIPDYNAVLYIVQGCTTWPLTLRKGPQSRLRVKTGYWGKYLGLRSRNWLKHEKELHNCYSSPDIVGLIKSRTMDWRRHVACMRDLRNAYTNLNGESEWKKPLWKTRVDGGILLKLILSNQGVRLWSGFIRLKIGTIDYILSARYWFLDRIWGVLT